MCVCLPPQYKYIIQGCQQGNEHAEILLRREGVLHQATGLRATREALHHNSRPREVPRGLRATREALQESWT